jgi:hypothetical protein
MIMIMATTMIMTTITTTDRRDQRAAPDVRAPSPTSYGRPAGIERASPAVRTWARSLDGLTRQLYSRSLIL